MQCYHIMFAQKLFFFLVPLIQVLLFRPISVSIKAFSSSWKEQFVQSLWDWSYNLLTEWRKITLCKIIFNVWYFDVDPVVCVSEFVSFLSGCACCSALHHPHSQHFLVDLMYKQCFWWSAGLLNLQPFSAQTKINIGQSQQIAYLYRCMIIDIYTNII